MPEITPEMISDEAVERFAKECWELEDSDRLLGEIDADYTARICRLNIAAALNAVTSNGQNDMYTLGVIHGLRTAEGGVRADVQADV